MDDESEEAARIIKRERKSLRWQSQRAAYSARKIADAMTCDLEAT